MAGSRMSLESDKTDEMRRFNLMNTEYKQMPIKVADIQFAYDNAEVINLMRKRGEIIKAEEIDHAKRQELND